MMWRRSEYWRSKSRAARSRADYLVRQYGIGDLPIPLAEVAAEAGIARIEFRPLLTDGILAIEDNQFVVCLNCDDAAAMSFHRCICNPLDSGRSLRARTRFTLAHEIAHTFFFSRRLGERKPLVRTGHPAQLQSLERVCNEAAGRILVPEHLLKILLQAGSPDVDLFEPVRLLQIARDFKVSADVLVRRLRPLAKRTPASGVILVVRRRATRSYISAMASDVAGENVVDGGADRVPHWLLGESGSGLTKRGRVERIVEVKRGGSGRVRLQVRHNTIAEDDEAVLITARIVD